MCVRAIPKVNRLYAACQRHNVEFVAICGTTGAEKLEDVHMLRPIEYPCAIDVRKECEQALQVKVMPAFFVIDADGIIRAGGLPSSRVEAALKEVLGLPEDYDLHGE